MDPLSTPPKHSRGFVLVGVGQIDPTDPFSCSPPLSGEVGTLADPAETEFPRCGNFPLQFCQLIYYVQGSIFTDTNLESNLKRPRKECLVSCSLFDLSTHTEFPRHPGRCSHHHRHSIFDQRAGRSAGHSGGGTSLRSVFPSSELSLSVSTA